MNAAFKSPTVMIAASVMLAVAAMLALSPETASAQTAEPNFSMPIPKIPGVETASNPKEVATTLEVVAILTVLTLAPAILILTTSFTRIIIVLSLLRQALATQQLPPNQVLIGLALFMTFVVMGPTWKEVNDKALAPYMAGTMSPQDAYSQGIQPVRAFMIRQTRPADVRLFLQFAKIELPSNATYAQVPTLILMPAFMISELKTSFEMGFRLYLPFLIIDIVISSVLISMGMLMLPPVLISLPFKLLLFVLADGWYLIVGSLMRSFQ